MTSSTACVRCGVIGNVRWERVLMGTLAFVEYYCGRCEHQWRVHDGDERATWMDKLDRRAGRTDKPDRRSPTGDRRRTPRNDRRR